MKKSVLTLLATMALASTVLAQGTINLNNLFGGGKIYDSDGTTPYEGQFTVALYGGANAGALALVTTYTVPPGLSGTIFSGTDFSVPNVAAGDVGTFELLGFAGPTAYPSVAAARAALVISGTSGIWTQPTGGVNGGAGTDMLNPPVTLSLTDVPEPSVFALTPLIGGAMFTALVFRRRK